MASEILINVRPSQTRVAYVEGKILKDLKIERKTAPTLVGSVYKGKVIRVLPGMQAAFVDIGLDRAAFLYVGDIRGDKFETPRLFHGRRKTRMSRRKSREERQRQLKTPKVNIQDLIKEGQFLLVQVAKDPLGTKGLASQLTFLCRGRTLVYMPTLSILGISTRLRTRRSAFV